MSSLPPRPAPPPPQQLQPLPAGWSEHKAPTGHIYYYNAATKTSTYARPLSRPLAPLPSPPAIAPSMVSHGPHGPYGRAPLPSQQSLARQLPHQFTQPIFQPLQRRPPPPKKQGPLDRPKKKRVVVGAEPWVLVTTKMGRTFVHNPETKISLWTAPKDVQEKLDELPPLEPEVDNRERDERRRRRRREREAKEAAEAMERGRATTVAVAPAPAVSQPAEEEGDDEEEEEEEEEYEEYEESGEEEEREGGEDDPSAKRVKLDPSASAAPQNTEYTEDDITWQLAAMQEEYGLGDEDLADDNQLDSEESINIFREMLLDNNISPYSPWDLILPIIADDTRYTILPTTKARKAVFTDWCRDRIAEIKAEKDAQEKVDPRIPFWVFLKQHASTKLYWPEFKRKYRKDAEMKDPGLTDKEREKMYRDYVAKSKTSDAVREADLKKLLTTISGLSRNSTLDRLPTSVIADVRYVVCPEVSRDRIIKAYLETLPEAPISEEERERQKREAAMRERERAVRREKAMLRGDEERARQVLAEEEAAIERAKQVGKKGLAAALKRETS